MKGKVSRLIKRAIDQAMGSREFYLTMAILVNHRETKETFEYLAHNEQKHINFFQNILAEEACPFEIPTKDVHLADLLELPHVTRDLSPKEALIIAVKREEASHRFYQNLADHQPPGTVRHILEEMALIKLEHKDKLEYIYDNVAFPEVW